jgi:Ni,Fe-hydrogenase maturation factor
MKPLLVIGLGNRLMGDEGIGWHVADRLAGDPRLPEPVEVLRGGTDLLRYAGEMEGRNRVILIDAIDDGCAPGSVTVFDGPLAGRHCASGAADCWKARITRSQRVTGEDFRRLEDHQEHAHHLSVIQAVELLQLMVPARFTLLGIAISSAKMEERLSPLMDARLAAIVEQVLDILG